MKSLLWLASLALTLLVSCGAQQRNTPSSSTEVETLGGGLAGLELDAASYLSRSIARHGGDDCTWTLSASSDPREGSPPPRVAGGSGGSAGWLTLNARLHQNCDDVSRAAQQVAIFATDSSLGDVSERHAQWSGLTSLIDLMVAELLDDDAPSNDANAPPNTDPAEEE